MVQSLANIPIPTAAPDQAIRIQIPAINIDAPIVQGDGWEQLKKRRWAERELGESRSNWERDSFRA